MKSHTLKHLSNLFCILTLSLGMTACGMSLMEMEPPTDGVQLKITNNLSQTEADALVEALESLDAGINSTGTMTVNGAVTVNLSPIADLQDFIRKINVGTIESVDQNVITLEVDTSKL